ncbi:MAG: LysM peptidoglycan-binding domain-containing protein [Leptospirales bacterium]
MSRWTQAGKVFLYSAPFFLFAAGCSTTGSHPGNPEIGTPITQNVAPPTIPSPSPEQLRTGTPANGSPLASLNSPGANGSKPGQQKSLAPPFFMRVPDDSSIEWYSTYFQTVSKRHFSVWLSRSTQYLPFIKSVFREEGLPEDLAYLSLIESGFSPRAYSSSRAAGLWQFMPGTGRKYGLKVNAWIDQRRDPILSTYAAAHYLKDLYTEFHSWSLALAAYNAGEGKLANAVADTGTKDYWEIRNTDSLSNETKEYVPKYLAAVKIAKDPSRYGFGDIDYMQPLDVETVTLHHPAEVRVLAKAAGISLSDFRKLNPAFTRWATPPHMSSVPVNLPKGEKEAFLTNLSHLPKTSRRELYASQNGGVHIVRSGDSLWTISRHYGVSVQALMDVNGLTSRSLLHTGKKVLIPSSRSNYHVRHRYSRVAHGWMRHRIRRGESLFVLAKRFRTTISAIRVKNHLSRRRFLREGQMIMVPIR